jgi:hypothetical protein
MKDNTNHNCCCNSLPLQNKQKEKNFLLVIFLVWMNHMSHVSLITKNPYQAPLMPPLYFFFEKRRRTAPIKKKKQGLSRPDIYL